MGELISKFELLDPAGKQQLLDYLEFLLSKKKEKAKFDVEAYRENLLKVSVWSEEDLAVFDEVRQHINQWKVKEW